jgi:MFS family permease
MPTSRDPRLAGRVAFTHPDFVVYTLARFLLVLSLEMLSVTVAWQVYEITHRPLDLGYVGLAQFLPGIVLFLFAGHAADLFDRRQLLMWCYAGFALCAALLLLISWRAPRSVHLIYVVLALLGAVRSFNFPTSRAILPHPVKSGRIGMQQHGDGTHCARRTNGALAVIRHQQVWSTVSIHVRDGCRTGAIFERAVCCR